MKKGDRIQVRFVEYKCYKCGTLNHLYFADSLDSDEVHYECDNLWTEDKKALSPEIVDCVESYAKTEEGKKLNLAKVDIRFSKTVEDSYRSFGCSKCDAIFGDWYVNEAYIDSLEDDNPNVVELTI